MPSRSPFAFQRRKQLRSIGWPAVPKFSPDTLLIHKYPSEKTVQKLQASDGDPAPDRAKMVSWSPPPPEE